MVRTYILPSSGSSKVLKIMDQYSSFMILFHVACIFRRKFPFYFHFSVPKPQNLLRSRMLNKKNAILKFFNVKEER